MMIPTSYFLLHTLPMLALGIWGIPMWSAAGAAAPIIIHLLNRLRFDRVKWAAMEFLLESRKRNRRRVNLEQLLLLLLRVLIMLLLSLSFARIAWGPDPDKSPAAAQGGPESHIVLLDVSQSMGARVRGTPAFNRARDEVKNIVAKLKADDELTLVWVGRTPEIARDVAVLAEGDAAGIASRLDDLKPDDTEADFSAAVELLVRKDQDGKPAGLIARADPRKKKVLHIISDFRRAGWAAGSRGPMQSPEAFADLRDALGVQLDVVDAGAGSDAVPANLAVVDIRPKESELTVFRGSTVPADRDIEFLIRVRNTGDKSVEARLDAFVDGRRQIGPQVSIAPGSEQPETITVRFPRAPATTSGSGGAGAAGAGEAGAYYASVIVELVGRGGESLLDPDTLASDNRRRLAVRVLDRDGVGQGGRRLDGVHVMLVSGDVTPRDVENGFALPLLSALTPSPREGDAPAAAVGVTHLSEDGFRELASDEGRISRGVLSDVDCLILANVDQVPTPLLPELGRFIRSGGTLAVFCGDRMRSAVYNEELYRNDQRLLPAALNQVVDAARTGGAVTFDGESFDFTHPVFADLAQLPEPLTPAGVRVNRYFRIKDETDPEALKDVKVLARWRQPPLADGKPAPTIPAVLERKVGRGRVLLFTGGSGEPWNDWPTDRQRRGSFVIAMQGLVQAAVASRSAEVEAGRLYEGVVLPRGIGSARADRSAELRGLSLAFRDDPTGRADWRTVSGLTADLRDSAAEVRFADTRAAGIYRLAARSGTVEMFAVNGVASEGDLGRLSQADRDTLFSGTSVRTAVEGPAAGDGSAEVDERDDPDDPRPVFTARDQLICQIFLGVMMALMVLETVLSRKFAHYD